MMQCKSQIRLSCVADVSIRHTRATRHAFTLTQLLIGISITSMLTVVLGGLLAAVHTAQQHSQGLQSATLTSQAAAHRIRLMFEKTATYQLKSQPARLGVAVVYQTWLAHRIPNYVVMWTGGLEGELAEQGTHSRLPLVNELLIYGPDPENLSHLVEMRLPDVTKSIDFSAADFNRRMLSLIHSRGVEKIMICNQLQVAELSGGRFSAGNVRFELHASPSVSDLETAIADPLKWKALAWSQGIVGLRQISLDTELLIDARSTRTGSAATDAIPFFDSAIRCYVHQF